MKRGRPVQSEVRQNMVEIVAALKSAYGYEIYSFHKEIFPAISARLIYYHLKKGLALGEFKVHKVVAEKGDYSWGPEAQKTYYSLGPEAKPKGDPRVLRLVEKRHRATSSSKTGRSQKSARHPT